MLQDCATGARRKVELAETAHDETGRAPFMLAPVPGVRPVFRSLCAITSK
jgi:hypothetical protein